MPKPKKFQKTIVITAKIRPDQLSFLESLKQDKRIKSRNSAIGICIDSAIIAQLVENEPRIFDDDDSDAPIMDFVDIAKNLVKTL